MKKSPIWYWASASDAATVSFIRWTRVRMNTGGKDTNKMGIGAVVYNPWRFSPPLKNFRQRRGLPEGYYILRSYWDLYLEHPVYTENPKKLKRPTLKKYARLERRRKKRKEKT